MDLLKTGPSIPLDQLRNTLVRLEDTIIFAFIERAQFKLNRKIYIESGFQFKDGFKGTFLNYFLHQVETVHAKVRRYTSPDEYPFTTDLPEPILPALNWPDVLYKNEINVNQEILNEYIENIVPKLCIEGDDLNYGTSATRDVELLQAMSRRIHYGKFIAESKFQDPLLQPKYISLIKSKDSEGILELLTNVEVEKRLLARLKLKASIYGQDIVDIQSSCNNSSESNLKIDPELIVQVYKDFVIPLTKKVEVEYLLGRLDY